MNTVELINQLERYEIACLNQTFVNRSIQLIVPVGFYRGNRIRRITEKRGCFTIKSINMIELVCVISPASAGR